MSDTTTKKQEVSKPPFDPTKLLNQLKGIVDKNKQPTKGGGKSWLGTLIIIAVVLVGVAVWSWLSWRQGRELAKLRHAKNKARITQETAIVKAQVAENDAAVKKQMQLFDEAEKKLKTIEAAIKAEEKQYAADMRAIDSIRSWRDASSR